MLGEGPAPGGHPGSVLGELNSPRKSSGPAAWHPRLQAPGSPFRASPWQPGTWSRSHPRHLYDITASWGQRHRRHLFVAHLQAPRERWTFLDMVALEFGRFSQIEWEAGLRDVDRRTARKTSCQEVGLQKSFPLLPKYGMNTLVPFPRKRLLRDPKRLQSVCSSFRSGLRIGRFLWTELSPGHQNGRSSCACDTVSEGELNQIQMLHLQGINPTAIWSLPSTQGLAAIFFLAFFCFLNLEVLVYLPSLCI